MGYRDREVVPAVPCVQEPIVAVLVLARKEHHDSTSDLAFYLPHQLRDAGEPEERGDTVDADDGVVIRFRRGELLPHPPGDILQEILFELELEIRGGLEVALAVLRARHPLGEGPGQVALDPAMPGLLGRQFEKSHARSQAPLVSLVVDDEHGALRACQVLLPRQRDETLVAFG